MPDDVRPNEAALAALGRIRERQHGQRLTDGGPVVREYRGGCEPGDGDWLGDVAYTARRHPVLAALLLLWLLAFFANQVAEFVAHFR